MLNNAATQWWESATAGLVEPKFVLVSYLKYEFRPSSSFITPRLKHGEL